MELPSSVVACHGWSDSVLGVDFAGSAVVHSKGGVSPLAGTVVLGPRKGRVENPEEIGCHNLPLVVIGTFALCFGWYGFEPGSTLGTRDGTTEAMATQVAMTALGAAACGIMVFLLRCAIMRNYDVGGLCTCILGGLVSITLGCGDMECGSAVAIGANVEPSHLDEACELDVGDNGPRGAVPTIEYLHDCLQFVKVGAEYRLACLDGGASGHVRDMCLLHEAYVLGYAYGTQPRSDRDRQYTKALDVGLCRHAAGRSCCGHDLPMLCVF